MFTLSQVAAIAGIAPSTLRMWFARGHLGMQPEDHGAGQGKTRYLSLHSTVTVAVAAALARLGVPLATAVEAGMMFGHTTSGDPKRPHPGDIYGDGKVTILAVRPRRDASDLDWLQIFPVGRDSDPWELLSAIYDEGATFVPIDPIHARIRAQLATHK